MLFFYLFFCERLLRGKPREINEYEWMNLSLFLSEGKRDVQRIFHYNVGKQSRKLSFKVLRLFILQHIAVGFQTVKKL